VCETKQEGSNQSDQSNEILSSKQRKKADLYYRSNHNRKKEIYLSRSTGFHTHLVLSIVENRTRIHLGKYSTLKQYKKREDRL
jgi:hypothetical protein